MSTKKLQMLGHLTNIHKTEAEWEEVSSFIPAHGQFVVYDSDDLYNYTRFKIGDGKTPVGELPFINQQEYASIVQDGKFIQAYYLDEHIVPIKTEIAYSQSGSGDPHYGDITTSQNIRPIVGERSSIKLYQTYEPDQNSCYTANFNDVVAEGMFDWSKGELVFNKKCVVLTGEENFYKISDTSYQTKSGVFYYTALKDGVGGLGTSICSHFKNNTNQAIYYSKYDGQTGIYCDNAATSTNYYYKYFRYGTADTTVDDFKAFVKTQYDTGTPIQIVYELAEPIVKVIATPPVIARKGNNIFYSDAENITANVNKTTAVIDYNLLSYITPQMFYKGNWDNAFNTAIQIAMLSGVEVYVPAGTYSLDAAMYFSGTGTENVSISFAPGAKIVCANVEDYTFNFVNCASVSISGGAFTRDGALSDVSHSRGLFELDKCIHINLKDINVNGCLSGVAFHVIGEQSKALNAQNCHFNECSLGGILMGDAGPIRATVLDSTFTNFYAKDSSIWYSYPVCVTYGSYDKTNKIIAESLIVRNCLFENCHWEGPDSHGCKVMEVDNCVMHNCGRFMMDYMDGRVQSDPYSHSLIVSNCTMYNDEDFRPYNFENYLGNSLSIYGQLGRVMSNVTIRNTRIERPTSWGEPDEHGKATTVTNGNAVVFSCIENLLLENNEFIGWGDADHLHYAVQIKQVNNAQLNNCSFQKFTRPNGIILPYWAAIKVHNCNFNLTAGQEFAINNVYPCALTATQNQCNGILRTSQISDLVCSGAKVYENTYGTEIGFVSEKYIGLKLVGQLGNAYDKYNLYRKISATLDVKNGPHNVLKYTSNSDIGEGCPLMPNLNIKVTLPDETIQTNRIIDIKYTYGHKATVGNDSNTTWHDVSIVLADDIALTEEQLSKTSWEGFKIDLADPVTWVPVDLEKIASDYIKNKPEPMTDEEIDAICGSYLTIDFTSNVILKDAHTGIMYKVYVEDGKLHMMEVE